MALELMIGVALVLVSACLAKKQEAKRGGKEFEYSFWYNYDVQVYDWLENGFHGQKPARGSSSAVNTPYGLYLNGQTVMLPPNTQSSSTVMKNNDDFTLRLIMRYLPGVTGTTQREIISLSNNASGTRLELRQQIASPNSSPIFELEYQIGKTLTTRATSANYALSKTYLGKWYYFQINAGKSGKTNTEIELCVNESQQVHYTEAGTFDYDWSKNTLGGSSTKGIYYWFMYTSEASTFGCGSSDYFVTTASGSPCSYVCPSDDYHICNTDGVTFDYDCNNCASLCGNYGCIQNNPETCWTASCPPNAMTDAGCTGCYAHSLDNSSDEASHAQECKCASNYYRSAKYPLTCLRKL
jgi:hypothetical protein